jgi:hypothetical protein
MDEREMYKRMKKAKRINYIAFCTVLVLASALLIAVLLYKYQHSFTTEKWLNKPEARGCIVDDMLSKHDLLGMTKEQIESLLGDETDPAYFKTNNNLVYYLGPERGLISIDSEWLIITFENDVVCEYDFTTD